MSMVKGWDRLTVHFHTLARWLNMLAWWLDFRAKSLEAQLAPIGVSNGDIQSSILLHQLLNYCTQFWSFAWDSKIFIMGYHDIIVLIPMILI